MGGPKYSQDCHFFINSFCSKGDGCSFRHSDQARQTDTVCYYWQNSECTRHLCPYRHSEVSTPTPTTYPFTPTTPVIIPTVTSQQTVEKKVNKQCFWDKQPSGCSRRHCSYLHFTTNQQPDGTQSKASGEIRTSTGQQISSGSIILNREKLQSLKDIIPISSQEIQSEDSRPRRVVVPPATGMLARREVTGGIKTRLGVTGQMKDRLGSKGEDLSFLSDGSREMSPDLEIIEELRSNALMSIDLRNRIDNKVTSTRMSSESPEILQYESDNDQRRSKIRQEKRDKKARKKKKKAEREKEKNQNIKNSSDLPSASDYSDLDTPAGSPDPSLITAMSRTAGMYADTKAINKSAKIRLGKRKAHGDSLLELDDGPRKKLMSRLGDKTSDHKLNLIKPRRGSLIVTVDRNPSPPQTAEQIAEAKYRTIYSRSPSPITPRLKSRRRSTHRSRSLSPSSPQPSKMSRLTDEDLMAMNLSDLQELISKKKKVKTKKNKKDEKKTTKKIKEGKKKEDKKMSKKVKEEKKKKKLKKKESRSDSSPSPSPPPVHAKKRTLPVADGDLKTAKLNKAKLKEAVELPGLVTASSLLDDAELEHQMRELLGE